MLGRAPSLSARRLPERCTALTATDCNWSQFDLGWMYTFFFVLLGVSAAIWGGWLERAGPRKAGVVSALCWCGGLLISAFGVYIHQLWLMWLGSGVIGGIGLGLGYISPVSTLIKWFPDRRGMATGMAIMGFGGGAMIGSPLATLLMNHFKTPTDPGVWQTFVAMAAIYFVFMLIGAFGYRLPPAGWKPEGWTPPSNSNAMITSNNVHLQERAQDAAVLAAVAGAVPQRVGRHRHHRRRFAHAAGDIRRRARRQARARLSRHQEGCGAAAAAAAVGAGFVGLISLFNIFGRIAWASSSDKLGRKRPISSSSRWAPRSTCWPRSPPSGRSLALFVACFCVIASMYGGGFATIPAYLADMFGTQFVGAIHGRLLTAWSTAGILGPVIVNYLHDTRLAEGIAARSDLRADLLYPRRACWSSASIANLLVRPVNPKWHMSEAEVAAEQAKLQAAKRDGRQPARTASARAGSMPRPSLFWLFVGVPLGMGHLEHGREGARAVPLDLQAARLHARRVRALAAGAA